MCGRKGYDPQLYSYNYVTHPFLDLTPGDFAVFINQVYLETTRVVYH